MNIPKIYYNLENNKLLFVACKKIYQEAKKWDIINDIRNKKF